jgi:hypothetical protein
MASPEAVDIDAPLGGWNEVPFVSIKRVLRIRCGSDDWSLMNLRMSLTVMLHTSQNRVIGPATGHREAYDFEPDFSQASLYF